VLLPDSLWNKHGLCPQALIDFKSQGENCVVQQLAVCLKKTAGGQGERSEPQLSLRQVIGVPRRDLRGVLPGRPSGATPSRRPRRLSRSPSPSSSPSRRPGSATSEPGERKSLEALEKTVCKGNFLRDTGLEGFGERLLRQHFRRAHPEGLYAAFFRAFPRPLPRLRDRRRGRVDLARGPHRGGAPGAGGAAACSRDAPYETQGWRDIGPTVHMIVELCRRLDRKVRVIHNYRCFFEFMPGRAGAQGGRRRATREHQPAQRHGGLR
jgi:hypothetical protein